MDLRYDFSVCKFGSISEHKYLAILEFVLMYSYSSWNVHVRQAM
jgi:hypothetical protein